MSGSARRSGGAVPAERPRVEDGHDSPPVLTRCSLPEPS